MTPSLLPCGDSALTVQIGESIDAEANARIIALAEAVEEAARSGDLAGVLDIVPTYRSLLVRYDPERIRAKDLGPRLLEIAARPLAAAAGRLWRIPLPLRRRGWGRIFRRWPA